jgi:hypothetical protein
MRAPGHGPSRPEGAHERCGKAKVALRARSVGYCRERRRDVSPRQCSESSGRGGGESRAKALGLALEFGDRRRGSRAVGVADGGVIG